MSPTTVAISSPSPIMLISMASAAQAAKICTLLLLVAAQLMMLLGTAAASSSSSHGGGGCIRRVDEVSTQHVGSCQCYHKCSDPEEGWLTTASSQRCFVDCVLRQGDRDDGDGGAITPTAAAGRPVPAGLPAAMNGMTTVRVYVERPKVGRSRSEKEREVETLVVEVTFVEALLARAPGRIFYFDIHVNAAAREEEDESTKVHPSFFGHMFPGQEKELVDKDTHGTKRAVLRMAIGDRLEKLGLDREETIAVSLHPPIRDRDFLPKSHTRHRLTIHDVRIEYAPK